MNELFDQVTENYTRSIIFEKEDLKKEVVFYKSVLFLIIGKGRQRQDANSFQRPASLRQHMHIDKTALPPSSTFQVCQNGPEVI